MTEPKNQAQLDAEEEQRVAFAQTNRVHAHALQAACKFDCIRDPCKVGGPEHWRSRAGINTLFSQQLALAELLVARGLFTEAEYMRACNDALRAEVDAIEAKWTERRGAKVTFV